MIEPASSGAEAGRGLAAILLIEDSADDVELTRRAFKRNGVRNPIVVARDGPEALDYLLHQGRFARPSQPPLPGLILLDLKLPKVSGLEVLREIKGHPRLRRIPVIALTSSRHERDVMAAYDLGVNSYVVKPVEFSRFAEAIRALELFWLATAEPAPLADPHPD